MYEIINNIITINNNNNNNNNIIRDFVLFLTNRNKMLNKNTPSVYMQIDKVICIKNKIKHVQDYILTHLAYNQKHKYKHTHAL